MTQQAYLCVASPVISVLITLHSELSQMAEMRFTTL
jgi:hypothetical protein